MRKLVILQSNYIPWKGYFDLIHDADLFIFHDDLQYTKNDWRNRNRIKTPSGSQWLTIPVGTRENRLICEVEIQDHAWQRKHWNVLRQCYSDCPYFDTYKDFFEAIYLGTTWHNLSELNQHLIVAISRDLLGLGTRFEDSRGYCLTERKQARVMELIGKTSCRTYISGPAARAYLQESTFEDAGVELIWKDYSGYPAYDQCHPPFEHGVSIVDLLFHTGPKAWWYIWGWREGATRPL